MADREPQFESVDRLGTTTHFNGAAGSGSWTAVPSSAGAAIAEVFIHVPQQTPSTRKLLVSFDGGTTSVTLEIGEGFIWSIKGDLTQIHVKGNENSVTYEIVMNREPA